MALTNAGLEHRQRYGITDTLYMAVGTGTATFDLAMTAMGTELTRVTITSTTVVGAMIIFAALFTNNQGNGSLTEWGVWDASSGGNLLAYGTFASAVTKANTDAMVLRLTDTIANA